MALFFNKKRAINSVPTGFPTGFTSLIYINAL